MRGWQALKDRAGGPAPAPAPPDRHDFPGPQTCLACLQRERTCRWGSDLLPGSEATGAGRDQAREWLRAVGLGDHLAKAPHDLSVARKKQAGAIAAALAATTGCCWR